MAVTESSGNGYALYNGVKLPNIESVWTDKEKYPYAYISGIDDSMAVLSLFNNQAKVVTEQDTKIIEVPAPHTASLYYLDAGDESWTVLVEDDTSDTESNVIAGTEGELKLIWANVDVLDTDNITYLDASDPIPLDGMTVIEWDGVTDGLMSVSDVFYKLSDLHLSKNELVGGVYVTYIPAPITVTLTEEDIICLDSYPGVIAIASDLCLVITQENAALDDFVFPEVGIYGQLYPLLLAYTPASTEPEEPEKPTTDSSLDPTSMLMGWLVGRAVASQRGKVTPSEPDTPDEPEKQLVGYSYNGVVLSDINEVWTDELKAEYPYAVICYVDYAETLGIDIKCHGLWCSDQPLTCDTDSLWWQGETSGAVLKYCSSTVFHTQADIDALAALGVPTDGVTPGVWTSILINEYNSETDGIRFVGTPVWSNYDVLNEDGTTYLAASDPIPVYE